MTSNALFLHFLTYMAIKKQAISTGHIKSKLLGYKNVRAIDVFNSLINSSYVISEANQIQISKSGKEFIENLEKNELKKIHGLVFDNYDFALIEFLYNRNDFVQLNDFPEVLKSLAPQHGNSINNGNLIQSLFKLRAYINEEQQWYIINDVGREYYENQIIKDTVRQKFNNSSSKYDQVNDIPVYEGSGLEIPILSDVERIWLSELYNLTIRGEKFTSRKLWTKLATILPRSFKIPSIDPQLISSNGEEIRVLGVVALEGNYRIIDYINKVINSIRSIILSKDDVHNLTINEIAKECELTTMEVSLSLKLARHYINLYSGSTYNENSTNLVSINIDGNEEIFYNYLHFEGIQFYMRKANNENFNNNEYFSKSEIEHLNAKLDHLAQKLSEVILSQQFSYDDMMEELNELKSLYGLKKKNWKRLLVAKVTEMTGSGVVGSMISEPLADMIKPELNKLLI